MNYYGDNSRWFMGTVVNINDPLELGRIKVRIFGVHTANTSMIEEGDLPWAQVVIPVTEGGSSGIGTNIGIKVQAQVYGVFLDGKDSQLPLVLGSVPKYERPSGFANKEKEATVPDQLQHDELIHAAPGGSVEENRNIDNKYLVGSTNIEKSFNFFLTKEGGGFTPHQACGIIGNFYIESGASMNKGDLNTKAQSAPPERSFGIAQWNSSRNAAFRYQNLVSFSASRNLPWDSLYAQLLFTIKELNDHKTYYRYAQLKKAKSVMEATFIFESRFENPKIKKQKERVEAAEEVFRRMNR